MFIAQCAGVKWKWKFYSMKYACILKLLRTKATSYNTSVENFKNESTMHKLFNMYNKCIFNFKIYIHPVLKQGGIPLIL